MIDTIIHGVCAKETGLRDKYCELQGPEVWGITSAVLTASCMPASIVFLRIGGWKRVEKKET